ncbi:MAG: DNA damage-inducible protein D [Candidatus Peribacteraceae bacterium]|nr:DNA damage-inducible protein D [Candidatus Peribacteraceae bacterium]
MTTDLTGGSLLGPHRDFESIKKVDADGIEYWEARELMPLLEYAQWRNFESVIRKAQKACNMSGQDISDHFADISKMSELGQGGHRKIDDYKLSRYACYLIAQNGDADKKPIALAQTYFAIQTRKQELYELLPESKKRLMIRSEVTDHNKKLAETAKKSGVTRFGTFNDAGYLGLYGMTHRSIQIKKGLGKDKVLDRAGATELAANLFRITQTDDQLQKRLENGDMIGERSAANTHFKIGGKVRQTIKDIGGTLPEHLKPEEDIRKLERRMNSDERTKLKQKREPPELPDGNSV